jgi:hypothetical protein
MDSAIFWAVVYLALGLVTLLTLFRAWVVRGDWSAGDRWRTTALVVACLCALVATSDLVGLRTATATRIGIAGLGVVAAAAFLVLQFGDRRRTLP